MSDVKNIRIQPFLTNKNDKNGKMKKKNRSKIDRKNKTNQSINDHSAKKSRLYDVNHNECKRKEFINKSGINLRDPSQNMFVRQDESRQST